MADNTTYIITDIEWDINSPAQAPLPDKVIVPPTAGISCCCASCTLNGLDYYLRRNYNARTLTFRYTTEKAKPATCKHCGAQLKKVGALYCNLEHKNANCGKAVDKLSDLSTKTTQNANVLTTER